MTLRVNRPLGCTYLEDTHGGVPDLWRPEVRLEEDGATERDPHLSVWQDSRLLATLRLPVSANSLVQTLWERNNVQ